MWWWDFWNPSTRECECDKACGVGKYLYFVNCKCRNRLINKPVEKCDEVIDGNKIVYNATLNDYERACKSCTLYIVLSITAFIKTMDISGACFYFYWHTIKNCSDALILLMTRDRLITFYNRYKILWLLVWLLMYKC